MKIDNLLKELRTVDFLFAARIAHFFSVPLSIVVVVLMSTCVHSGAFSTFVTNSSLVFFALFFCFVAGRLLMYIARFAYANICGILLFSLPIYSSA